MATCSLCGRGASGAFCAACGAPVSPGQRDPGPADPREDRWSVTVPSPTVPPADPGPVPTPSPPGGPQQPKKRPGALLVVGGAVVALVAVVALLAMLIGQRSGSVAAQPAPATSRAFVAADSGTSAPTSSSTRTWSDSSSDAASSSAGTDASGLTGDAVTDCSPGIQVNETTSCPFALNVADALGTSLSGTVTAYSPTTEQWYDMTCTAIAWDMTTCTGGRNAVVHIRR